MNLGVERSCIGDIVVNEGKAVCFVKIEVERYFKQQISKIGRVGVKIVNDKIVDIDFSDNVEVVSIVVSSLRLDAIVSALTKLSRDKAAALINSGKVFTNYNENKKVSYILRENDIITIRGYGKFIVKEQAGTTKKGRIKININHYR